MPVWTHSGGPPALQIETESTEAPTEPTLPLVSPWYCRELVRARGTPPGLVGSRFLTIVQNRRSLQRAFSWALGRGCAPGSAKPKSGYAPEHRGAWWGDNSSEQDQLRLPHKELGRGGGGRESRAFRFEPGKPNSQAEFRDSHWLLQRRDISAEGWEEPGRGVSQRLAHPEPGEPEETNAGAAMGLRSCRGAKHTEGSARPCGARARGVGDRGRAVGTRLWPCSRARPG